MESGSALTADSPELQSPEPRPHICPRGRSMDERCTCRPQLAPDGHVTVKSSSHRKLFSKEMHKIIHTLTE